LKWLPRDDSDICSLTLERSDHDELKSSLRRTLMARSDV